MRTDLLPPGFETLEPFVDHWAFDSTNDRLKRRLSSSEADRIAFFTAAKDRLPDGLTYLDKPFAEHDDDEHRFMQLFLSFAHIALAVEVQRCMGGSDTWGYTRVQHLLYGQTTPGSRIPRSRWRVENCSSRQSIGGNDFRIRTLAAQRARQARGPAGKRQRMQQLWTVGLAKRLSR